MRFPKFFNNGLHVSFLREKGKETYNVALIEGPHGTDAVSEAFRSAGHKH
jgi:hypothetical protein